MTAKLSNRAAAVAGLEALGWERDKWHRLNTYGRPFRAGSAVFHRPAGDSPAWALRPPWAFGGPAARWFIGPSGGLRFSRGGTKSASVSHTDDWIGATLRVVGRRVAVQPTLEPWEVLRRLIAERSAGAKSGESRVPLTVADVKAGIESYGHPGN